MLGAIGCDSMDQLIAETVPADIMIERPLTLANGRSESEMLVRRGAP
jgi:glycine cleavage system pyridoxal-binding protein P